MIRDKVCKVQLRGGDVTICIDFDPDHENDDGPYVERWGLTVHEAARLLAGLEVALEKALENSVQGRCLKCGHVLHSGDMDAAHPQRCVMCRGGILSPAAGRGGE